jgi:hypothetical protein
MCTAHWGRKNKDLSKKKARLISGLLFYIKWSRLRKEL